jgi:hypothetical protein
MSKTAEFGKKNTRNFRGYSILVFMNNWQLVYRKEKEKGG